MSRQWFRMFALFVLIALLIGCGSGSATPETQPVARPIPADSPFAKVKVGMGQDEVFATIGQPTSMGTYMTGKSFIPYHFGGDNTRTLAHYKGIGTITFSQDNAFTSRMSVISVDYDPEDPGFDKK